MQFIPRKLLFKAWNQETGLMMRLTSIDCVKGELVRENHILLQFTGLCDMRDEEIYEMDLVLIGKDKFIVCWDSEGNRWALSPYPEAGTMRPLLKEVSDTARRICNYFESQKV